MPSSTASTRRFQFGLVLATWVFLALSFIGADFLAEQPLHHIPTVIGLLLLGRCAARGSISDASMTSISVFLWLHILGARYVYSYVPYDTWSRACVGVSITDAFHLSRNHYDRLVHLLYGALAMVPQVEVLRRRFGLGRVAAIVFSIALVSGVSALYEIVEWLLTVVAAPERADRYNGQQGDAWDAQKDMACAVAGAIAVAVFMRLTPRSQRLDGVRT